MTKTSEEIRMVRYLSRRMLPLAAGIGLLLALLGPITYWIIEHRNLQRITDLYARELAEDLQGFALESPTLWKYQAYKFNSLLDRFHPAIGVLGFNVLDENGAPISGYEYKSGWGKPGRGLTFAEDLKVTLGTAPIIFNNRRIGSVELLISDALLLRACALLFCISALVGTSLALLVYLFPVRVARKMEGEIEGLVSVVEQSEERYRSLLENIPDVAWTSDREGNSTFMSPKTRDVIGYTPEEICTAASALWFDSIHPDDREMVTKSIENLFTEGAIFDAEYRYRTKDGKWIWLHDRANGIYERNGKMYADGLFTDITEQKLMEEALTSATAFARIVMDSIDDAISIVDVNDYRIMGCNAGFLKVSGLTMEDVVGSKCYELTHHRSEPCSPPFEICPMKETVITGNYSVAEHTHFLKNGDKFFAEVSTSPVFDANGKVVRAVHVARDITERKRSEEKIHRLNEELEFKVEEKTRELLDAQEELVRKEKLATLGQLSGSVGHELRNPLGVMSNAVYFLNMVLTEADETTREYLDIIKHEIENSQRIISDLLDFARTKPPQTKTVTANELVAQCIVRCTIPGCVTVLNEIPDTLPPLKVDPQQMGQVLHNLITNAIQAMPDGGALKISARRERERTEGTRNEERGKKEKLEPRTSILDPGLIEISVEDSGAGISPENMKKLFQPLFTTKPKGIGLGLVVCRNLVEANGGRIEVESHLGEGTTFSVALPVERGET